MEQFIGTKPVAEKQRFDVARLETYLRAHVEGFSGTLLSLPFGKEVGRTPPAAVAVPVEQVIQHLRPAGQAIREFKPGSNQVRAIIVIADSRDGDTRSRVLARCDALEVGPTDRR